MTHSRASVLIAWLAAAVLVACRSDEPATPWSGGTHARCPVCVCEGDLACVDVRVGAQTPKATYGGETFCFCSEECRCQFLEHPEEFVRPPDAAPASH